MDEILMHVLSFSERASTIAHSVRQDPNLFKLLIEEKDEIEKNKRFQHDFKTLADVLIQEALKYHLHKINVQLSDHVRGEESTQFTNTLGETITIRICATETETCVLLAKVLNGNEDVAAILANLLHKELDIKHHQFDANTCSKFKQICVDQLGIWIDPIDSTGEYVKGCASECVNGVHICGLSCVTVLIGLYDRSTGIPVAGVINQPFSNYDDATKSWSSKTFWGVHCNGVSVHNIVYQQIPTNAADKPTLVISNSESHQLRQALSLHFNVICSAGAGYKCLSVIIGVASVYVCSRGTTYRWDTAAPHGILQSLGGGLIAFKCLENSLTQELTEETLSKWQLKYEESNEGASGQSHSKKWCNVEGFIAYCDPNLVTDIQRCLLSME